MQIKTSEFVISNSDYKRCPEPTKAEIAFIGRSNVGKSSLINILTNKKNLAKTSSTPGKTQLINHFEINDDLFDIYAKVEPKNSTFVIDIFVKAKDYDISLYERVVKE